MTRGGGVEIRRFHELADVAPLAPCIDALNLASPRPSPFATYAHLERAVRFASFSRHTAPGKLWFLGAFTGESLVGFLALKETTTRFFGLPARRLEFLVTRDFDRPCIVAAREYLEEIAHALYCFLIAQRRRWDYLEFGQQDGASILRRMIRETAVRGLAVREFENWENCTVPIQWSSVEQYLEALERKFRANVKRQMRKLFASGELEVLYSSDPANASALLALYCDIERRSWKSSCDHAVGFDPQALAYYRDWFAAGEPFRLEATLLLIDGLPIAGSLVGTFDTGSGAGSYALQIAYDRRYHAAAPGSAIMMLAMHRAIERRHRFVNLLAGFAYYKRQWLADVTPLLAVQVYRVPSAPYLHRWLGDLRRKALPNGQRERRRFNPGRYANGSPACAPVDPQGGEAGAQDAVVSRGELAQWLAETRRGRCDCLSSREFASTFPFVREGESPHRRARADGGDNVLESGPA